MTFKHVRGVSLRRSLACVAGASVLALTLAQGAVAQDSDDEGDVVIATGIRQALENALEEKRNAVNPNYRPIKFNWTNQYICT